MARVRYTGNAQIYLPTYYRALRHGDEIDIPDSRKDSFLRRPDFEEVAVKDETPRKKTDTQDKGPEKATDAIQEGVSQ